MPLRIENSSCTAAGDLIGSMITLRTHGSRKNVVTCVSSRKPSDLIRSASKVSIGRSAIPSPTALCRTKRPAKRSRVAAAGTKVIIENLRSLRNPATPAEGCAQYFTWDTKRVIYVKEKTLQRRQVSERVRKGSQLVVREVQHLQPT